MADGQQGQSGQQRFGTNDYYLKQQAERMLSAIQKGFNENYQTSQVSMPNSQASPQVAVYMNHQVGNNPLSQQQQAQQQQQHQQQQATQQQGHQTSSSAHNIQVQHQQLQHQLQQVQQAQQQFQQMQQLAQMQQQFQQQYNAGGSTSSGLGSPTGLGHDTSFSPSRRGRKPTDKRKRKRHTFVKRPTTAYLYFVSKYRETLKEAGEVVPKAKIITQACAEKWRHMTEDEKEPFLELARRDRERWEQDKSLEKRPRDPNRPKRPPSAYFLFLADFRKSYPNKTDPAKEITKKAGERWNGLSDLEKTPYYRNAQVERAKWEMDLEAYKQSQKNNAAANAVAGVNRALNINSGQQQVASSSAVSSPSPGNNAAMPNLLAGQASMMGGAIAAVTTPESPSMTVPQQQSPQPQTTSQAVYAYPGGHHLLSGSESASLQQFHAAR